MDAPTRLAAAAAAFGLRLGKRLTGGFRSEVAAARTTDGTEVVLKAPATFDEARAETAALIRWQRSGAVVTVLDVDVEHGVLMLERLDPGTALPPVTAGTSDQAAELLHRLHACDPGDHPFASMDLRWRDAEAQARRDVAHERRARGEPERGAIGLGLLPAAADTVTDLVRTTPGSRLLHGDFTNKNILANGPRFTAIDPIPVLGDPCADIGHFAAAQPAEHILETATAIAASLGLDPERAMSWTVAFLVLQDCQAWRPDQAELDTLLRRPETLDHLCGRGPGLRRTV